MRFGRRERKTRALRKEIASRDSDWSTDLRAWVLSLPFVEARASDDADVSFQQFLIDCPPLRIRRVWLLMESTESVCDVMAFVTHADGHMSCIELSAPYASVDPRDVEAALLVAYKSAFAGCSR